MNSYETKVPQGNLLIVLWFASTFMVGTLVLTVPVLTRLLVLFMVLSSSLMSACCGMMKSIEAVSMLCTRVRQFPADLCQCFGLELLDCTSIYSAPTASSSISTSQTTSASRVKLKVGTSANARTVPAESTSTACRGLGGWQEQVVRVGRYLRKNKQIHEVAARVFCVVSEQRALIAACA
jgi:hypothetical protein